jgi:UPF0755 protein
VRWFGRLFLLSLVAATAVGAYAYQRMGVLDGPLRSAGGTVHVEIPRGTSFKGIVEILEREGVISDPLVFELYGRYRRVGSNLKAGTYAIDLGQTPRALLEALEKGTLPPQLRVTIPEGYNRWQIADLLWEKGIVERADFLARVKRGDLEGKLFPDTYLFRADVKTPALLKRLTDRFDAVWADVVRAHPGVLEGQTAAGRRTLLIIASLVEREAQTDRDRPLVARVFFNRLKQGMKLQTDPTCVYGPTLYRKVAHPRYCKDSKSEYSTYVIDGLPPTAISNPGRAALTATFAPAKGAKASRLLYFVAKRDGSGEHHFSETYAEHNRAVRKYLMGGRAKGRRP